MPLLQRGVGRIASSISTAARHGSPRMATAENHTQSATHPSRCEHVSSCIRIDDIRPSAEEFFADCGRNRSRTSALSAKNEKRQICNLSFCHQSLVLRRERLAGLHPPFPLPLAAEAPVRPHKKGFEGRSPRVATAENNT